MSLVPISEAEMAIEFDELASLAATANEQIALAERAAATWVSCAIAAGEALGRAWELVPAGEWNRWITANVESSNSAVALYMRIAFYKGQLNGAQTVEAATLAVRGLPAIRSKTAWREHDVSAETKARILRMRENGMSWQAISRDLGMSSGQVVRCWVEPSYHKRLVERATVKARKLRQQKAAAKKALERSERDAWVRKAGGDLSVAYAEIRKALLHLDSALVESEDVEKRTTVRQAMLYAHNAEDAIVAALKGQPAPHRAVRPNRIAAQELDAVRAPNTSSEVA